MNSVQSLFLFIKAELILIQKRGPCPLSSQTLKIPDTSNYCDFKKRKHTIFKQFKVAFCFVITTEMLFKIQLLSQTIGHFSNRYKQNFYLRC